MALSAEELAARRDQLLRILYAPTKEVYFDDVKITYKTDEDIQAAIAAIDGELAAVEGTSKASHLRTSLRSGYW